MGGDEMLETTLAHMVQLKGEENGVKEMDSEP